MSDTFANFKYAQNKLVTLIYAYDLDEINPKLANEIRSISKLLDYAFDDLEQEQKKAQKLKRALKNFLED